MGAELREMPLMPDALSGLPQRAVKAYAEVEFARLDRKVAIFRSLPDEERDLLPEFEQRITAMAACIDANSKLLSHMAASTAETTSKPQQQQQQSGGAGAGGQEKNTNNDAKSDDAADERKLLAAEAKRGLTLLARDWSESGAEERRRSYGPLIGAVEAAFEEARRAVRSLQPSGFRVLVPGAGAGRLAWELACRGFVVEGCEPSFTALLVGNYVMNRMGGGHDDGDGHNDDREGADAKVVEKDKVAVEMYPYAHAHSNVRSKAIATRAVRVPDVDPKQMPGNGNGDGDFSMRGGNFVELYDGQNARWDAVAGYLALDVGEGCVEHVRRVAQILKPGGVWAFVGPAPCVEDAQADAVHISVEEFVAMVRKSGFKIVKQSTMTCLHSTDPESMRIVRVQCPFIVAVKVRPVA